MEIKDITIGRASEPVQAEINKSQPVPSKSTAKKETSAKKPKK